MMFQQQQQTGVTEHLASDSVSGSAIDKALSAGAQINWKIGLTIVVMLLVSFILVLIIMEMMAIKRAGGFKEWVRDVPLIPYRTVRMQYISEGAVIVLTFVCVAHAVWPQIVGEVQMELVYGLFAFIGVSLGINVTAFNIASKNQPDASQIAATAAAADPLSSARVTTNARTGETVVESVPLPVYTSQFPTVAPQKQAADAGQALRDAGMSPLAAHAVVEKKPLAFIADD